MTTNDTNGSKSLSTIDLLDYDSAVGKGRKKKPAKKRGVRHASSENAERYDPSPDVGLTAEQVAKRTEEGYLNITTKGGGKSYLPYFVKSAEGENGREVYTAVPVDSGVSISPTTASSLKEMLRTTVSNYYGDYMFGDVTMCGKTGTAERDDGNPHAWFAGFSYDDSFPYAIITVVEDSGSGLKYAGTVAAHMMQSLYDKTVNK